jgi:hypothetical protein
MFLSSIVQAAAKTSALVKCEAGNMDSCSTEANRLFKAKEWDKAADLFDKSCDKKHLEDCHRLAISYSKQSNEVLAKNYLVNACDFGHHISCDELQNIKNFMAENEADARAFEKDDEERKQRALIESEAEADKKVAAENAELNKLDQQIEGLKANCARKKKVACINLGRAYNTKNLKEEAGEAFEKACDLKDSESCAAAGLISISLGHDNYGKRLLTEACEMKNRRACKSLDEYQQNKDKELSDAEAGRVRDEQEARSRMESERLSAEREAYNEQLQQAEQVRRRQAVGQALKILGDSLRQQSAPPQRTQCRSYRVGNEVETDCQGN